MQALATLLSSCLMLGRQARMPIDLMYDSRNEVEVPATEWQKGKALQEAYCSVREKLGATHATVLRPRGPRTTI